MPPKTIYALSSGNPPAAIAVIRISGPDAHATAERLCGRLPAARQAAVRELKDPATGAHLDEALVFRFDAGASATGEPVVELHCHGGRAVVAAILKALSGVAGLRQAEPGEFTRRAFENGRIDLTEAEGLADLLEAETERQRQAALLVAEGGLRRTTEGWLKHLVELSARAEAAIDYVDEDSVDSDPRLAADCEQLGAQLHHWLLQPRAEPLKEGVRVVIAGPPNVGKSSLLNVIAGYERAIVASSPGTTRDHIEVPLSLSGVPFILTDTAGVRDASDAIEGEGVERARSLMERADILLWLGEPNGAPDHPRIVRVHSRADLPDRRQVPPGSLAVSAHSGEGVSGLLDEVSGLASGLLPAEGAIALNRRQASLIQDAADALAEAAGSTDIVLLAEHLRSARSAFERLTGRAGVEDVLDSLFSRFCLGK